VMMPIHAYAYIFSVMMPQFQSIVHHPQVSLTITRNIVTGSRAQDR
jgi:hypothetical protein